MSAIGMPSHILALFAPRPPLERAPVRGRRAFREYSGLAEFVALFENERPEPPPPFIAPAEQRQIQAATRLQEHLDQQARRRALYDPQLDLEKQKTTDPKKTLFVGRLNYETTQKKLLKVFETYGPVRDIRVVTDTLGKPRGYAFVEFKSEDGMWNAYKNANSKVIDGKAILVDTEKARVVSGWLPRRLGGGEGPGRKGGKPPPPSYASNESRYSSGRGGWGGNSRRPRQGVDRYRGGASSRDYSRGGGSGRRGGRYDRPNYDRAPYDRPAPYGNDRPVHGGGGDRPSYGGDRPAYGADRPAYERPSYDKYDAPRPSYSKPTYYDKGDRYADRYNDKPAYHDRAPYPPANEDRYGGDYMRRSKYGYNDGSQKPAYDTGFRRRDDAPWSRSNDAGQ